MMTDFLRARVYKVYHLHIRRSAKLLVELVLCRQRSPLGRAAPRESLGLRGMESGEGDRLGCRLCGPRRGAPAASRRQ